MVTSKKSLAIVALSVLICGLSSPVGKGSELRRLDYIRLAITGLQPKLKGPAATEMAKALQDVASAPQCGVAWQILLSVAFHESSLDRSATGTRKAHTRDYGLMQVNDKNLLRRGLDKAKLLSDVRYSLQAGCGIIRENRDRYGQRFNFWLGIYRSGTALWRHEIRQNAIAYDRIIRRTAGRLGYQDSFSIAHR